MSNEPTIAAIATAPGLGGVGVVRVSGALVPHIIRGITAKPALVARLATFTTFRAADGSTLDSGLALHFPAPHSYTGEHVLELQGHGGPVVLQMVLARCLELGARYAAPGEFTRRAYLNDKLDLAQAESVADLIEAATESAVRAAQRSLSGAFSAHVNRLVDQLIHLRMLVEATLDFPEEDIDFVRAAKAGEQVDAILVALDGTLQRANQGALLRRGIKVVLAGRPNVGKSSLLNALAGAEVAIVTPIAGTTRDRIEQAIQVDGVALHIVDTAGLRETEDAIEQIGIARTWSAVDDADVLLRLLDAREPQHPDEAAIDAEITRRVASNIPRLAVHNKIDLLAPLAEAVPEEPRPASRLGDLSVRLSAKRGIGLDDLRTALLQAVGYTGGHEDIFSARARHLEALHAARAHIALAQAEVHAASPALEVLAEELRLAQNTLSAITGEFTPDDLLGKIFGKFCIGK